MSDFGETFQGIQLEPAYGQPELRLIQYDGLVVLEQYDKDLRAWKTVWTDPS